MRVNLMSWLIGAFPEYELLERVNNDEIKLVLPVGTYFMSLSGAADNPGLTFSQNDKSFGGCPLDKCWARRMLGMPE